MYAVEKGYRAIYDDSASAVEYAATSIKGEISRRIRISVGNFQQLYLLKSLLNPFKGRIAFEFISHKFLRSFSFLFMLILFIANIFINSPYYFCFFFLQLLFYLSALLGYYFSKKKHRIKLFTLPFYLFLINYASLLGFFRFLFGTQKTTWEKSNV